MAIVSGLLERGRVIVLDTHVLVWLDADGSQLGVAAADRIDREFKDGGLAVSAISSCEAAMLVQKGRLDIAKPLLQWRRDLIDAGLIELPLGGSIGISACRPIDFHGDLADRLIVATALEHGCALLTADRKILDAVGGLEAIDARA